MKKTIAMTLLVFGLIIGFAAPAVLAAEQTSQPENGDKAEKEWHQALKTQVALVQAKVALLEARSDLWLKKNSEASLRSLKKAMAYLNAAYQRADKSTQRRIDGLKTQAETAKNTVREEGQQAASQLSGLAAGSEAALNTAISETQAKAAALKKETFTRMALAQAKAVQLQAKIALEIDKAPEKAKQALNEVETYLTAARASAYKQAVQEIAKLQSKTREAKNALTGDVRETIGKLDALIAHTEELLQEYGDRIKESEEADLLRKRFAQFEAQAALINARLAAEKKASYEQARYHLDEAKTWYARIKGEFSEDVNRKMADIEKHIDDAKAALEKKSKEARQDIANLLNQAADLVEGKE